VPALLLGVVSCYPGQPEDLQQLDTALTLYDDTVDFSTFSTYAMPTTVDHFCPDSTGAGCIDVPDTYDQDMLNLVAQNMSDLGYTRIDTPNPPATEPDVIVTVGVTASNNWVIYGGYPWYPWYPWYPGWGPWYPPYWSAANYQTGTIIIMMADVSSGSNEQFPVVWEATLNGLLGTSSTNTLNRITTGINQAFDQSPYLQSGN